VLGVTQAEGVKMKITKEELKELNEKGSVEIWINKPEGAEHYQIIEVLK